MAAGWSSRACIDRILICCALSVISKTAARRGTLLTLWRAPWQTECKSGILLAHCHSTSSAPSFSSYALLFVICTELVSSSAHLTSAFVRTPLSLAASTSSALHVPVTKPISTTFPKRSFLHLHGFLHRAWTLRCSKRPTFGQLARCWFSW